MKPIKDSKKKNSKRKSKETFKAFTEKKPKNDNERNDVNINSSDEDNKEIKEPTREELIESIKPENTYSIQSIRAKQKENHEKNIAKKKSKYSLENKVVLEHYLSAWKEDRPNWKYKKLLQTQIVAKMFDEEIINSKFWPIVVEYLNGSEGEAKNRIIERVEHEISKLDEQIDKGKKELLKSVIYSRARELLQLLN